MKDNYKINISGTYGSADDDIRKIYLLKGSDGEISKVYVEYNDGTVVTEEKPEDVEAKAFNRAAEVFMFKAGAKPEDRNDKWVVESKDKGKVDFEALDSKVVAAAAIAATVTEAAEAKVAEETGAKVKNLNIDKKTVAKIAATAAALTIVGVGAYHIGKFGFGDKADTTTPLQPVVSGNTAEAEEEAPVKEAAEISDESEKEQKEFYEDLSEGTQRFNKYLKKFYATITEDDFKALKEMGYVMDESKDYANFAFEVNEVLAANFRYIDYTNEQLAVLNHGELLDVSRIMNSAESDSNNFETDMMLLLALDEDYDFNIKDLFPDLTDKQAEEFNQFLPMLKEYKKLLKEEKYKEAEDKMKDIKHALSEYAYGENQDKNSFKAFTLKTVGTASSILSQIAQYKQDVTYAVFNVKTGKEEQKTIKGAPLFDEKFSRDVFLGWEGCEEVQLNGEGYAAVSLTIYGLSKDYVIIEDYEDAIVDRFLGNESGRLEDYNAWIGQLRMENATMDGAFTGAGGASDDATLETNSEYDQLIYGTVSADTFIASIQEQLEDDELVPVNMEYYNLSLAQYAIAFKDAYTVTANGNSYSHLQKGDTAVIGTFTGAPVTSGDIATGVMKDGGTVAEAVEQAKKDWENSQEDGHDATDKDGNHDPEKEKKIDEQEQKEAEEEEANLQDIYSAAFNYALGSEYSQYFLSTSLSYDSSWLSSNKPGVAASAAAGLEDGALARQTYSMVGEEVVEEHTEEHQDQQEEQKEVKEESKEETKEETTEENKEETDSNSDEGITYEDPTTGEGFAPAAGEEGTTYTEDEIDKILDQMIEEAAQATNEEAAPTLTK